MSHIRMATALSLAIAATAISVSAYASTNTAAVVSPTNSTASQTVAAKSPSRNYVTANAQGLVVVLDRQTGAERPLTGEEAERLAQGIKQLVNQSTDGLVEVHHADGSVSIDLQGRFQNVMLAQKEADGSVSQACVDNVADAAAFFDIDPALVGAGVRAVNQSATPLDIR